MALVLVGVNHKTCHLETREKFFLQPAEKDLLLAEFRSEPKVLAAVVLSTCNRTEIYADLLDADAGIILDLFFSVKHLPHAEGLEKFFYIYYEKEVVEHLFRVVTGLDSMILGEKQILGQVKYAVGCSAEKKMLNRTFNILSNLAIETGKKVRRETLIDFGGSSISWAAVTKAEEVIGSLAGKTVLVIGAGKMGALAIQQLKNKGVEKIYIMNRTFEKARELAQQCGLTAVEFWQMRETLEVSDLCICSAGAPHYLVDKHLMTLAMASRQDRKFVAVDISVPRNIEPQVTEVPGVSLLTVDDLEQTVEDSMNRRKTAVDEAEKIIRVKIEEFYRTLDKAATAEFLNEAGIEKGMFSE